MHYVYLLRSLVKTGQTYVGRTEDLRERLAVHNAGESPHTSKFVPWELEVYVAFRSARRAREFEIYLKSGSGRTFAKRHLWSPPS